MKLDHVSFIMIAAAFLLVSLTLGICTPELCFGQIPATLWTRTYGSLDNDYGGAAIQLESGGYAIVGERGFDTWLLKIDELGDTLWTKMLQPWITASEIQQTNDGGYIIVGTTIDAVLIKTDSMGNVLWWQYYGTPLGEMYAFSVKQTADNGYVMVGRAHPYIGDVCGWVLKTDSLGFAEWGDSFDGYCGYEIQLATDSGYIVAGGSSTGTPGGGAYIIKYSPSGLPVWQKVYGGAGTVLAAAVSICPTSDQGYILASRVSGDRQYNLWLLKLNSLGDTLWTRFYQVSGYYDWSISIRQTYDNGFIFGGSSVDIYLMKTDSLGNILWTNTYGGANYESMGSVEICSDKGYIIAGSTNSFGVGGSDIYIFRLAPDTLGVAESEADKLEPGTIISSLVSGCLPLPNGVKCKVFDITGRVAEPANIQPGIYFIEVEGKVVHKVVKIR